MVLGVVAKERRKALCFEHEARVVCFRCYAADSILGTRQIEVFLCFDLIFIGLNCIGNLNSSWIALNKINCIVERRRERETETCMDKVGGLGDKITLK